MSLGWRKPEDPEEPTQAPIGWQVQFQNLLVVSTAPLCRPCSEDTGFTEEKETDFLISEYTFQSVLLIRKAERVPVLYYNFFFSFPFLIYVMLLIHFGE